ncbi:MAG TPA: GTP-binding protein [Xanthobacteraceae bacterium]|nr:GTP-binding protein [Xanthobacteraceae bacterium]
MIPVCVLTGFLGSGKTTLLARLLKSPQFARTAVIVNEFGEVGLDHDLIETSDESFVTLQTGCLCCTIRGDLVLTLSDILRRRDEGRVTPFDRVVIETSGLADPAPILHAVMGDEALAERLTLAGVVTTVDAVHGAETLARQPESVKQVAVADRLVLTKTDLVAEHPALLADRLAALNPSAPLLPAQFGDIDPARLFDARIWDPSKLEHDPEKWEPVFGKDHAPKISVPDAPHHHHHDERITCFALLREEPIPAVALTLFLEVLAEHCGADLLRLKGIVAIAESPDRPAVIHGVQHVFHAPAFLDRWPSEDRRSRLVFIARDLPREFAQALMDAIEAEVRETANE